MDDVVEGAEGEVGFSKGGSFKEICMEHFRRVIRLGSVEFRGGFYMKTTGKDGQVKETYVPDSREEFFNAVYMLGGILVPKFKRDKEYKNAWEEFNTKIKKLNEDFIKSTELNESVVLGSSRYNNSKDRIRLEELKIKRVDLAKELFITISNLFGKLNYFEMLGGDDEA